MAGARGGLRILSSPRWRRRLGWLGGLAVVCGGIALIVLLLHGPKSQPAARPGKPQVVAKRPTVRLTRPELRRVHAVAVRFIDTAVRRTNVDESWSITDATLKAGFTRSQWARGNIPTPPFPADSPQYAPYKVVYAFPNDVALVFGLLPEHGHPEYRPMSFTIELLKHGKQWLVSSFTPAGGGSADLVQQRADLKNSLTGTTATASSAVRGRLNAWWLAAPLGFVVLLVVLAPLSLTIRGRLRRARALRA